MFEVPEDEADLPIITALYAEVVAFAPITTTSPVELEAVAFEPITTDNTPAALAPDPKISTVATPPVFEKAPDAVILAPIAPVLVCASNKFAVWLAFA